MIELVRWILTSARSQLLQLCSNINRKNARDKRKELVDPPKKNPNI
jgi:hypothetical protein